MLTSKAFGKRKDYSQQKTRNEDLRVDYIQKSTRSSGATPIGCTTDAPNESPFQEKATPVSKA
jgi:hypothetical protein